ncbi:hypothetical protein PTTG_29115 [Puccinia triticina 1-1 BBBD Race 1]|uniref:DNA 3'-5' helicase n=1 Tax=Puccinia triticina (isolate 1-1 / race 1 (BBBD)) TaxID=630390 RepID=A0A180G6H9_PUCT1|nr:hypothetical protein PTTG_29115 [Puccinia triticina 1-1 BBBD Race 1]
MEHSMVSCHDLVKVFPSANDVPNEELVPSLVYSGSHNRTLTALDVISMARETPGESSNPKSSCARRYHSCTGEKDKIDCVEDFLTGKFPIISCTMALGLGQNWKWVRMVVHMGRGDPASIVQMVGRAGRDGRPGLAILFVEKIRCNGKNSADDFKEGTTQSDDDRMDALAITPVCLRIAFSIDNLLGYIPLRVNDPNCLAEKEREESEGFDPCCCSNCDGPAAVQLMENLPFASTQNFDEIMKNRFKTSLVIDPTSKLLVKKSTFRKRKVPDAEQGTLAAFQKELVDDFATFYYLRFPTSATVHASDRFGKTNAEAI